MPDLRPETIPRRRVTESLATGPNNRLTVVRAPAGYGKTTALVEWQSHTDGAVAWVTLDPPDNDPQRLLAHLLAALDRILPDELEDAQRALSAGSDVRETVVPLVANALAPHARAEPALVLDDYHVIEDQRCHAVIGALIDAAPRGVRFVVATRTEPPMRLARRRASGELTEIGVDELRFRRDECERLLNGSLGLGLEPDQLEAIDERLEGWAAGLSLVASSLPAKPDRDGFITALARSDAGVADYLVEEVLEGSPPAVREFLIRTSILSRLSPPLCEAVLDDPKAPRLLAEVERSNLFVTALDAEGRWLRYHPLVAAMLARELRARSPQLVPELHLRASEWFEAARMPEDAIEHAIEAGAGVRAATLLSSEWTGLISERRHVTVRSILDRMPQERGELGPFCEALDVLCMIFEGVDQRITHERAEALAAEHYDAPGVALLVDSVRISPFYGDVARAVEVGREAWERYGDAPMAQLQLAGPFGLVLWFAGDFEEARRLHEPRVRLEQPPFPRVWTLAIVALTAADQGDAELAERYAREALAVVEKIGGQTATEFAGLGWVVAEALRPRGKLDEAREHLSHALEVEGRRPGSVGHAVALTFDAQLSLTEGNQRRARESARRAREIVDTYPDVGTFADRIDRIEAALERRADDELLGSNPTAAELRVLALLPSELTLAEIAAELHLSTNTVRSHVRRLYRRLGAGSRADAVAAARERGLL